MEIYRPTVVSVVYQRSPSQSDSLLYAMVQKPLWSHDEWSLVQGAFEPDKDRSYEDTAQREPCEELSTFLFGAAFDTGICAQRRFSQKTLDRYPSQGYVGKESHYFGIEFLGTVEDIRLNSELSNLRFVPLDELLQNIKYADEARPALAIVEQNVLYESKHGLIYLPGLGKATPVLGNAVFSK